MKQLRPFKIVILCLVVTLAFTASPARFTTAGSNLVRVEGTSTLHDWKMEGTAIDGIIAIDPTLAAGLTSNAWEAAAVAPAVAVSIPVESIRSQNGRMDKLMQEALKAKANPLISYQMSAAKLQKTGDDGFVLDTDGKLTVAGATRPIAMAIHGTRDQDGRYTLTGEVPIRMSDFGIKPPTAMMGTIRTGDQVTVSFRWVVERRN